VRVAALDPIHGRTAYGLSSCRNAATRRQQPPSSALTGWALLQVRHPGVYGVAGVYIIELEESPVYVGECRHLAQSFNMVVGVIQPKNRFIGGQATNCKVNTKVLNG
jgi:hypothetical protein